MATSSGPLTYSGKTAENDLSTKQYCIVEYGAAGGQVDVCDATTDKPCGVLLNKPVAGAACEIAYAGISKVVYGGTVAEGDHLRTDTSGRAVATTTGGDKILGIANKAGAVTDVGEVLLTLGVVY